MLKLIKSQIQVIRALAIREMQSQQSNLVYGSGWVFFDAFLGFATLVIIRVAIRGFNRAGVPPITFLVSGLLPWMMFQTTYHMPGGVIAKGKRLLELPMVTELDLVLASAARIFMQYTILFVVSAVIAGWYEGSGFPRFPLGIALLFCAMSLMGISFGLILMTFNRMYPPASKFIGIPLRFSMLLSGVVFSMSMFPPSIFPYLLWNPLLHVEELLRVYWFYNYQTPGVSAAYVAEFLVGMVFFGLLIERYARRRLPP